MAMKQLRRDNTGAGPRRWPLTADCYDCRRRRAAVAGQQLVAIVDPRAAKLVTGRHWIEDDGAARLEATEKGIVERRGDC